MVSSTEAPPPPQATTRPIKPTPSWDRILAAAQKNEPEEIRRLVQDEGVDPSHSNAVRQSALHIAALWGHVDSVRALLALGADANAANTITGATPLHMSVQSRKTKSIDDRREVIRLLVEVGHADLSQTDSFQQTPADTLLMTRQQYNDEEQLASLMTLLQSKEPPIIEAIREGDTDQLRQVLVSAQEDDTVNVVYQNKTPFVHLIERMIGDSSAAASDLETMRLLLEHGANPNVSNEDGSTPLDLVCGKLRDIYKEQNDDSRALTTFQSAAILLTKHQEQDGHITISPATQQLLHDAARRNRIDMAQFWIVSLGVSPNARNRQGMTPLQFAARSGHVEMVRMLLHVEGIDVHAKDGLGQTALDAARANQREQVVALLEDCA